LKRTYGTAEAVPLQGNVSEVRGTNRKEQPQVFRLRLAERPAKLAQDDNAIVMRTLESGHSIGATTVTE
jgi:hypothetical protein